MLIDWFTVVAQLINFLILLVALRFLLYDRIVEAMDERRRRFEEREEEAERLRREAEEEMEKAKSERKEIESNWEDMMDEARREAEERRQELMEEARSQVETREQQWLDSLRARQDQLLVELQRETGERAISISRRAMADLAGADVEDLMVSAFVDRIDEITADDGDILEALRSEEPIMVRTAFALSDTQRETVRDALHDVLGDSKREIEWERKPEMIAGIALKVNARNIGWSIETYLDDVEDRFAEVLREQRKEVSEAVEPTDESPHREGAEQGSAEAGPDEEERESEGEKSGSRNGSDEKREREADGS